jgi:hypothetical protein
MSLADAAAKIAAMFVFCADEDLAEEIARDFQVDQSKAETIAGELRRLRGRHRSDNYAH